MKICYGFHKPLLFILALVSSCANSYGMEAACIVPTIVVGAGGLCCFYKRQSSPTPTRSYQLPQPLGMKSFSDNQQSTETESDYESPDSIFKSVLTRKNSNPKVLDTVDMGAEPSKK